MRVGIVGSRVYPNLRQVMEYVAKLPDGTVVVSGCNRHVDALALKTAESVGLPTVKFDADWERYGRAAGPIRNQALVDSIDKLVAFIDSSPCRGTRDALARAKVKGIPTEVIVP